VQILRVSSEIKREQRGRKVGKFNTKRRKKTIKSKNKKKNNKKKKRKKKGDKMSHLRVSLFYIISPSIL
jgi:hypothetical protein